MAADHTSHELLAHFDQPKLLNCPDFEWVEEADATAEAFTSQAEVADSHWQPTCDRNQSPFAEQEDRTEHGAQPVAQTRGVRWVLQWAAALTVFAIAGSALMQFYYVLAAEQALNYAARAGAIEATLPRATYQSIAATVERRLTKYPQLATTLQVCVSQNGATVGRQFRAADGDRVSVTLSAPSSTVLPAWLNRIGIWHSAAPINAHSEVVVPARKLRPAKS
jgi:hypothetical protein